MTETKQVTQDFLDSSQYLEASILQYESVYGEDFVSPGGREMAVELIKRMALTPRARVLDVGCGLGGSAFVMARDFDLRVDGIDLSKNMLALANKKLAANGLSGSVNLQWGDCLELGSRDRYAAVYSRDVFLHINDKTRLFAVLNTALHQHGTLLFTDYCCGPRPWSDDFRDYIKSRGYSLHTVEEYTGLIAGAGFEQVTGEDITPRFIEILRMDLERIADLKLAQSTRIKLQQSWQQKLARAEAGHQRWGLFTARKGVSQTTRSE
jgi:phosphoethanolamine N-methyltransferase